MYPLVPLLPWAFGTLGILGLAGLALCVTADSGDPLPAAEPPYPPSRVVTKLTWDPEVVRLGGGNYCFCLRKAILTVAE